MLNCIKKLSDYQVLLISQIPGIGRRSLLKILDKIAIEPASIKDLFDVMLSLENQIPQLKIPNINTLKGADEKATQILSVSKDNGISIISCCNPMFPKKFNSIPDPPAIIYSKGDLNTISEKTCVALIGTRKPSNYGLRWAKRVGAYLASNGYATISGLALGCDSAGHIGCLENHGYAVGVLPGGLDKIYPASNRDLGLNILESGGCLISEYPPGTKPRKNYFVERDRLQSGLSEGTIVVETDVIGGTMHTANFTLAQNRRLACLKHPIEYEGTSKSLGNAKLIVSKKAMPIKSKEDLCSFLSLLDNDRLKSNKNKDFVPTNMEKHKTEEIKTTAKPHQQIPLFEERCP